MSRLRLILNILKTWRVKCLAHSTRVLSLSIYSIFLSPHFISFSLQQLPVITSNTIVRCRSCRTYINPFVTFLDQRRWKCNLCYRVNDGMSLITSYSGSESNVTDFHLSSTVLFSVASPIIIIFYCTVLQMSFPLSVFFLQFQMSLCTTQSPDRMASPIRDQRSKTPLWSSLPPQTTW